MLQWHCLLNIVVCSTAIVCCATVALSAVYCGVQYSDRLLCFIGSLLNNVVCSTAIDCCATLARSAEYCGVQYSDRLLCYSDTVCLIICCAVQRLFAVLQCHCVLNNVVCSTALYCCATVALSAE